MSNLFFAHLRNMYLSVVLDVDVDKNAEIHNASRNPATVLSDLSKIFSVLV